MVPLRILGAVTALLFVAMVFHAARLEPSIPKIQLTFSEAAFRSILAQWQPSEVARFKSHFAIDFPFLVSYGLFGYFLCEHTALTRGLPALARSLLSWALPAAAVMDAGENLFHLYFVFAVSAMPVVLYFVSGVVATFKWLLIAAFVVSVGYARIRKAG